MRILVVQEEKQVAKLIKRELEGKEYQVFLSYDGIDGLKQAESGEFDLAVLDSALPKKDGIHLVRELRGAGNQIPILMVSAKSEVEDIVAGLDAGADSYMKKPFEITELQARVNALVRRCKLARGAIVRYADLRVDPVQHQIWRGKSALQLSSTEYRLLVYMINNAGKVVSRSDLADNCWEHQFDRFTNIIDVYINYLRRKVDAPAFSKLIHTVRGKGYMLEVRS